MDTCTLLGLQGHGCEEEGGEGVEETLSARLLEGPR